MVLLIILGVFLCLTAASVSYFESANAEEYIRYVFWVTWFAFLFIFVNIAIYIAVI